MKTKVFFKKCGLANVYAIVGEKTIIVDAGLKGNTGKILNLLEKNDIGQNNVSLILISHAHPDHCLNARHLKNTLDVPLAISACEAHYLEEGRFAPVVARKLMGKIIYKALHSIHKPHDETVSPEICFQKELDLNPFGVQGKVMLTPGHTLGSSSVLLDNGSCIIGDLLLPSPFRKKPILPLFIEDINLLHKSIKVVMGTNPKFLYPSHGKVWDMCTVRF